MCNESNQRDSKSSSSSSSSSNSRNNAPSNSRNNAPSVTCHSCGVKGHISPNCPTRQNRHGSSTQYGRGKGNPVRVIQKSQHQHSQPPPPFAPQYQQPHFYQQPTQHYYPVPRAAPVPTRALQMQQLSPPSAPAHPHPSLFYEPYAQQPSYFNYEP